MSIYQREGSPFWQYSFTVNGVRFRGSTGETGKREARQVEAQRRYDARHSIIPRNGWTLNDCLAKYWTDKAKHKVSAKATLTKLDALRRIIGKDTLLSNITNETLLNYRATRQRENLQAHSVNRDFAYLKAAMRHAQQIHGQQVPSLAWTQLKAKEPPGRIRFLSHAEYHRLLDSCADDGLRLIVQVAVGTGLRKNNIVRLNWQEVDLSSGMIKLTVKGGNEHRIRMTGAVRAALATLPHREGDVFDTRNFRKRWQAAVKKAELHDFRFHDLRHTFASWARMAGADIADICDALGHSSITVTMRYAHIEPEHHISAFDRISERVWTQFPSHFAAKAQ